MVSMWRSSILHRLNNILHHPDYHQRRSLRHVSYVMAPLDQSTLSMTGLWFMGHGNTTGVHNPSMQPFASKIVIYGLEAESNKALTGKRFPSFLFILHLCSFHRKLFKKTVAEVLFYMGSPLPPSLQAFPFPWGSIPSSLICSSDTVCPTLLPAKRSACYPMTLASAGCGRVPSWARSKGDQSLTVHAWWQQTSAAFVSKGCCLGRAKGTCSLDLSRLSTLSPLGAGFQPGRNKVSDGNTVPRGVKI